MSDKTFRGGLAPFWGQVLDLSPGVRSLLVFAIFLSGCASFHSTNGQPILWTIPSGRLSWAGELPVLHLSGSPYEMGYQQGSLLVPQVRASVRNAMAFVDREAGIPVIGRWLARRALDRAWSEMAPFVPDRYLDEMRGLADAAGIPLKTLQRIHALPELTAATCASFAALGPATKDGRLIQIRNLDWAIQSNVQDYAAILVHHPGQGHPFVSIGWLGFIGVISGINAQGISVGEIGFDTVDSSLEGVPMPFLLRRILEEADDLKEAVGLVQGSPRTVGYNYLFADHQEKQAVALETTRNHCAVFWVGEEPKTDFGFTVPHTIFRSDWALDPAVRDLQFACKGNPKRPGLESPVGSSAYDVRFLGQGQLLLKFHGAIDPEVAMAIARAIAPKSNMQSIVYAYPELWVATAVGQRPAAQGVYRRLDLEDLFR